jgi:glycosyltransferase involved in cell wall biosynthesis
VTGGVTLVLNCLRSGGAEKQLLWIASELVALGHPCCIFELYSGGGSERIEQMVRGAAADGVIVMRSPLGSGTLTSLRRLRSHIVATRPAVIWSWGLRADCLCQLARFRCKSGKWLVSIRSANPIWPRRVLFLRRLIARFCDGYVSNTQLGISLNRRLIGNNMPYWLLPNAVAVDQHSEFTSLGSVPERVRLIMLGNIKVFTKGYDLAAKLARKLLDRGLSFEFIIAGRPDEMSELEMHIQAFDVRSSFKFLGEVSNPELFLREGHVFVLLSRFEGMPNTLLEAMNVGLPAIATDVGDLRALKEKGAPFTLIPCGDVSAAAEAIENVLAQWSESKSAAVRGRRWVQENFSEDVCRNVLRQIIDDTVAP